MNERTDQSIRTAGEDFDTDKFTRRFLAVLGVDVESPNLETLTALVRAFLWNIPFENISKLYYLKRYGLREIPGPERYLDGIERHHFGGTCYSNSYYLQHVLKQLGYEARLCGGDMANPDAHLLVVVNLEGRDFLIDVGYAAPFLAPMPLDLEEERLVGEIWDDRYLLQPKPPNGRSRMELYRNGEQIHGYRVNPKGREFAEFRGTVDRSFEPGSSFLNSLLLARYSPERLLRLNNTTLIDTAREDRKPVTLRSQEELAATIEQLFGISAEITHEALDGIDISGNAWSP